MNSVCHCEVVLVILYSIEVAFLLVFFCGLMNFVLKHSIGFLSLRLSNCAFFSITTDASSQVKNISRPKKIVVFGNALLDCTKHIEDKSILARYQMEEGSSGLLDAEKLQEILTELCGENQSNCVINPGGSVLNTVRILKKLGTDATFFGSVGNDENGNRVKQILRDLAIDARLETINNVPTGLCICLITNSNRTLHANVGAAEKFSYNFFISHVESSNNEVFSSPEQLTQPQTEPLHSTSSTVLRPNERKQIIYMEGFFVSGHEDICEYIVKCLIRDRRRLALNLSAPFVVKHKFSEILHLCQHAFFIFGNSHEFDILVEYMGCKTYEEASRVLLQHGTVAKVIVVTNGESSITLITNYVDENSPPGEILFQAFNVPRVENVVDTTGAGDSFVAGFLHGWIQKRHVTECIRMACDVAAKVVTQIGCNLPE